MKHILSLFYLLTTFVSVFPPFYLKYGNIPRWWRQHCLNVSGSSLHMIISYLQKLQLKFDLSSTIDQIYIQSLVNFWPNGLSLIFFCSGIMSIFKSQKSGSRLILLADTSSRTETLFFGHFTVYASFKLIQPICFWLCLIKNMHVISCASVTYFFFVFYLHNTFCVYSLSR